MSCLHRCDAEECAVNYLLQRYSRMTQVDFEPRPYQLCPSSIRHYFTLDTTANKPKVIVVFWRDFMGSPKFCWLIVLKSCIKRLIDPGLICHVKKKIVSIPDTKKTLTKACCKVN